MRLTTNPCEDGSFAVFMSFLISHYCEGLINFQDDRFYDDVFFGSITVVFFTFAARKYTSKILEALTTKD